MGINYVFFNLIGSIEILWWQVWGFIFIKQIARLKWPDISTSEVDILTSSKDILFSSPLTTWPVMLTALPLITSNYLLNRHHNFMSWHFDLLKPNILILYSTLTNHYYFFFITQSIYFTTLKKACFWFFFFFFTEKWSVTFNESLIFSSLQECF